MKREGEPCRLASPAGRQTPDFVCAAYIHAPWYSNWRCTKEQLNQTREKGYLGSAQARAHARIAAAVGRQKGIANETSTFGPDQQMHGRVV